MSGETSTKKILILTANPKDTSKLRLDEEVRAIRQRLRQAKERDTFVVASEWAVRTGDLQQALFDFEPQIVHFCGHGVGEEGLAFENETGQAKLVSATALAGLFKLFKGRGLINLNHFPSVGTFHGTSLQKELHLIKSVVLRVRWNVSY